jgi:hypothetical protein
VTTEVELFHKENLINMGVANLTKLYPEWKYVAWVDADIKFMNPSIIQDTIRACNRYSVVQMWAEVLDLDPTLKPLRFPHWKDGKAGEDVVVSSFGYCHVNGVSEQYKYTAAGTTWHPGYAWAMRRDIWDALGGLLDIIKWLGPSSVNLTKVCMVRLQIHSRMIAWLISTTLRL